MSAVSDENVKALARQLVESGKNIILVFAFNGTGKTRFSVEYKNVTKELNNGNHSGVYYNAYSEDLFIWDNDTENVGSPIKLNVMHSSLNQYHSALDEEKLREKLAAYKPKFDFTFNYHTDISFGIESISFYPQSEGEERPAAIKSLVVSNKFLYGAYFLRCLIFRDGLASKTVTFLLMIPFQV